MAPTRPSSLAIEEKMKSDQHNRGAQVWLEQDPNCKAHHAEKTDERPFRIVHFMHVLGKIIAEDKDQDNFGEFRRLDIYQRGLEPARRAEQTIPNDIQSH